MGYNIAHTDLTDSLSTIEMLKRYAGIHLGDFSQIADSDTVCKTAALRVGPGGAYGITHYIPKDGESYYMGFVVLLKREKGRLHWKLINETSGPSRDEVPRAILKKLDILSDLDELTARGIIDKDSAERAKAWRNAGKGLIARKAKMRAGVVLHFKEPVSFGPGLPEVSRFQITEAGRTLKLQALPEEGEPFPCKLHSSLYTRDFSIHE